MNPAVQLRKLLLGDPASQSGTIVEAATATSFKVRAATGIIDAKSADGVAYHVGDEVLVAGGLIQGRVKPLGSVPVYNV